MSALCPKAGWALGAARFLGKDGQSGSEVDLGGMPTGE